MLSTSFRVLTQKRGLHFLLSSVQRSLPVVCPTTELGARARLLLSLLLIFLYSNCSFLWFCGVARLLPSLLLTHIIVPRLLLLLSCCCPPLLLRSLLLLSSLSFPSLLRLFSSRCAFWLLHSLLLLSSLVLRSIDAAVLLALLHALPFAGDDVVRAGVHQRPTIRSLSLSFMQFISLNFFSRCSSA